MLNEPQAALDDERQDNQITNLAQAGFVYRLLFNLGHKIISYRPYGGKQDFQELPGKFFFSIFGDLLHMNRFNHPVTEISPF